MSSYCMHGSGKGNTAAQPKLLAITLEVDARVLEDVMIGKGGMKFKNSVRL